MLNSSQMKLFFKRFLLVFGLVMVFAVVIEQTADNYIYEPSGSSQVSFIQLDKDNHRDVGDAVSLFKVFNQNLTKISNIFYFYNIAYQEPTLLVHLRPPNT